MAGSAKANRKISAQYTVAKAFDKFGAGIKLNLILHDTYIELRSAGKQYVAAKLEYKHIMDVEYVSRAEMTKVKKSVALRAIEGYLIAGNLGSRIGTATALQGGGMANKQVVVNYFVIGYNGKDQKEDFIILIDDNRQKGKGLADIVSQLACFPGRKQS